MTTLYAFNAATFHLHFSARNREALFLI